MTCSDSAGITLEFTARPKAVRWNDLLCGFRRKDRAMACPRCGCKETNQYDDEDASDDNWERCAACGVVFPIEDHADEDDDD